MTSLPDDLDRLPTLDRDHWREVRLIVMAAKGSLARGQAETAREAVEAVDRDLPPAVRADAVYVAERVADRLRKEGVDLDGDGGPG